MTEDIPPLDQIDDLYIAEHLPEEGGVELRMYLPLPDGGSLFRKTYLTKTEIVSILSARKET